MGALEKARKPHPLETPFLEGYGVLRRAVFSGLLPGLLQGPYVFGSELPDPVTQPELHSSRGDRWIDDIDDHHAWSAPWTPFPQTAVRAGPTETPNGHGMRSRVP